MKLVTAVLVFTLLALSAANDLYCSEQTLRECVPIKKCPSVWNKIEELNRDPDSNHFLHVFLYYVKYSYYCDCHNEGAEPLIECPDKLPVGFKQLALKNQKGNELFSKDQQKKKLLEECGKAHTNRTLVDGKGTDLTDYPWLALLQFENSITGERKFLCGGVLITDRHVLTAAHCVTSPSNKLISVRLGEHDLAKTSKCIPSGGKKCKSAAKDVEVAEYVIHEDYNDGPSPRFDDTEDPSDLAVVKLRTKLKFSESVRPICLPQRAELPQQRFEVAGWSTTMAPNAKNLPQKLHSTIPRITSEKCWTYSINKEYSSSDHICAGGTSGQACIADAGGPLMAQETKEDGIPRMTVFGITFMELPCSGNNSKMPGIFTKVHKYVPWIEELIFPSDI